jgi:hypothetical protein
MGHKAKFHAGQLSGFAGWIIEANVLDEENNRFGLLVCDPANQDTVTNKVVIWIDSDDEGNDCGAVFLQQMEQPNESTNTGD